MLVIDLNLCCLDQLLKLSYLELKELDCILSSSLLSMDSSWVERVLRWWMVSSEMWDLGFSWWW
jgi:hypothetical protein